MQSLMTGNTKLADLVGRLTADTCLQKLERRIKFYEWNKEALSSI